MTNINVLPDEIIIQILLCTNITFIDVVRFCSTNKRFYTLIDNNKLWRDKLLQRSSYMQEVYCNKTSLKFKEEVRASLICRHALMLELSSMSQRYYFKEDLLPSDLNEIDTLIDSERESRLTNAHFIIDELTKLLEFPVQYVNLTYRYYAEKIIRYVRQKHLKTAWKEFLCLPPQCQILEWVLYFVSQWYQYDEYISYRDIAASLNDIAEETLEHLKEKHPDHPILIDGCLSSWKSNNINDNYWDGQRSREIINVLFDVIFQKLDFHNIETDAYSAKSYSALIDHILTNKVGLPICTAIIFESVARRLGVYCEIMIYPVHLFLTWRESYAESSKNNKCFYIDIMNGGRILTIKDCPKIGKAEKCPMKDFVRENRLNTKISPKQVASRLGKILSVATKYNFPVNNAKMRSMLEFQVFIDDDVEEAITELGRYFLLHHLPLSALTPILDDKYYETKDMEKIAKRCLACVFPLLVAYQSYYEEVPVDQTPKSRPQSLRFAVGLIVRYITSDMHYECVIIGWDFIYENSTFLEIHGFNVDITTELQHGINQPFYKMLANNNKMFYVAQETLIYVKSADTLMQIKHDDIGRYFNKFNGHYYEPNTMLASLYPEDIDACKKLYP